MATQALQLQVLMMPLTSEYLQRRKASHQSREPFNTQQLTQHPLNKSSIMASSGAVGAVMPRQAGQRALDELEQEASHRSLQTPISHLHTPCGRTARPNDDWSTPPLAPRIPQSTEPKRTMGNPAKNRHQAPFFAAAQHNDRNSPIYLLPQSVLVRLLKMLDPVSIQCLRRTGRRFLQVFDLCHRWPTRTLYPWSIPKLVMTDLQQQTLKQLLEKDDYCSGCWASLQTADRHQRAARTVSTYLHCSGCQQDHPACLFTPRQRKLGRDVRLCVGHTGHVRLCQHKVVTWAESVSAQKYASPSGLILRQCKHSAHCNPCEFLPHGGLFWRIFRSNNHDNLSGHPSARLLPQKTGPGVITLAWTAHVKLTSASGGEQPFTASTLMDLFAKLRNVQARFTCPELDPGRVVESRLFDPNNCDCVRYVELARLTKPWNRSPNNEVNKVDTSFSTTYGCLNEYRNVKRLPPLVRAQMQSASGDQDHAQHAGKKDKKKPQTVGMKAGYESQHMAASLICPPGSERGQKMYTTVRPCRGGGDCLQVDYRWEISPGGVEGRPFEKMGSGWFQALDPASFEMEQDDEGYGLYWCRTESCRNYWRFTSSRLRPWLRHEDYWAACGLELGGKCAEQ